MDFPIVSVVYVGQRCGDAAFGHHRMRLAEQRFADQADLDPSSRSFDGRAQPGTARADDEHVVIESFVIGHLIRRNAESLKHYKVLKQCNDGRFSDSTLR